MNHYQQWRRLDGLVCSIDGCDKGAVAHGWCNKHYKRWRRNGDPLVSREKAPDGFAKNKKYPQVWDGARLVLFHRKLMAEKLGRPLLPKEVVHHKDLDPTNNDPNNLEVFPDSAAHTRFHAKLRREKKLREATS